MMKRIISLCLLLCLLWTLCPTARAEDFTGDERVVLGADLTEAQIAQVYAIFGLERGQVKELALTSAEEHSYLSGLVDESLLGTRAISCVYVAPRSEGAGLEVETYNLSWCTPELLRSALSTAGITDAKIVVTAPFVVSGTAAMAGIYKAYEDISGSAVDGDARSVGTREFFAIGDLASEIGIEDAVGIVSQLKQLLGETKAMGDEALGEEIRSVAAQYKVPLTDSQVEQLITLCRAMEKLDSEALKVRAEQVQDTMEKLSETGQRFSGLAKFFSGLTAAVRGFFEKIRSWFGR